jgi:MoxR-like ATPase
VLVPAASHCCWSAVPALWVARAAWYEGESPVHDGFAEQFDGVLANIEGFIRGKRDVVRLALVCLFAEGHLLVNDVPGVGKTSLARCIAGSIEGSVTRIQFTPDLLPSDITGVQVYNSGTGSFDFHPGPVFANVVLADEINRASPKTQSALLEVMEERHVTVEGLPLTVPHPFMVIGTENPIELQGTYPLPEAQIDRFMMQLSVGYPSPQHEVEILTARSQGRTVDMVRPVLTADDVMRMIDHSHQVYVAPSLFEYVTAVCSATRHMDALRLGASPRGALALVQASQAYAASQGRNFVSCDDVKAMAPYVLGHRLILSADAELDGTTAQDLIQGVLAAVPVPRERVEA